MSATPQPVSEGGVLFIFAHPDDEAFGLAGMITLLRRQGTPVTLVTATRGEVGEILAPKRATRSTLGAVREQELRSAMNLAGLNDVRILGYRDSGMAGTPENDDPRSLVRAPAEEVVALVAGEIRSVRPAAVVTFGEDGIYGHPDHVAIHHLTVAAIAAAADPNQPEGLGEPWKVGALYFSAIPRERIRSMAERRDGPFRSLTPEQLATMGTPLGEITVTMPVDDVVDIKEAVLRHHQTQINTEGPFAGLPRETVRRMLSWEFLHRAELPWPSAETDPILDLFEARRPDPETRDRQLTEAVS